MTKLSKAVLDVIHQSVLVAVETAITKVELRLLKDIEARIKSTDPTYPKYEPLNVAGMKGPSMEPVKFKDIPGGTVFRLMQGSQPLLKLDKKSWSLTDTPYNANAFYIRTGSIVKLDDFKVVMPLKATITIDE